MLKKELVELLKNSKDDDDIDEILGKAEPVKTLVNSGLTLDAFKNKVENDKDFKAYMDSEKDKHSKKSFETWKTNHLQELVLEEYKKQHPEATPENKEIADLKAKDAKRQAEFEKMKADMLHKDLTNKALKIATEGNLSPKLTKFIDRFVGNDEESTVNNVKEFLEGISANNEEITTNVLKNNTYKPGGQGGQPTEEATKSQINSIFGIK